MIVGHVFASCLIYVTIVMQTPDKAVTVAAVGASTVAVAVPVRRVNARYKQLVNTPTHRSSSHLHRDGDASVARSTPSPANRSSGAMARTLSRANSSRFGSSRTNLHSLTNNGSPASPTHTLRRLQQELAVDDPDAKAANKRNKHVQRIHSELLIHTQHHAYKNSLTAGQRESAMRTTKLLYDESFCIRISSALVHCALEGESLHNFDKPALSDGELRSIADNRQYEGLWLHRYTITHSLWFRTIKPVLAILIIILNFIETPNWYITHLHTIQSLEHEWSVACCECMCVCICVYVCRCFQAGLPLACPSAAYNFSSVSFQLTRNTGLIYELFIMLAIAIYLLGVQTYIYGRYI